MSFVERLTSQPLFIASLLAPLAPMAIMLLLMLWRGLQKLRVVIKEGQEKRQLAKLQAKNAKKARQSEEMLYEEEYDPYNDPDEALLPFPAPEQIPVTTLPEEIPPAEEMANAEKPEESNAIMQLINDVFVDDGANERYEILLDGTDDVSAEELVEMTNIIAHRLGISVSMANG